MFPDYYYNDIQVAVYVLSYDKINPVDILALIAASAALMVSEIPLVDAISAVRVGKIDGKLVLNPSHDSLVNSTIDMTVAGTASAITMVESGSAKFQKMNYSKLSLLLTKTSKTCRRSKELAERIGKPKATVTPIAPEEEVEKQ